MVATLQVVALAHVVVATLQVVAQAMVATLQVVALPALLDADAATLLVA